MPREQAGLARIPVLSFGFRPFFLGGAVWAAVAMMLWIGELSGAWVVTGDAGAVAWHAHSLLFGYVSAIVAGFLLTAVPNWTGRLPVRGGPLLALFLLWVAGRIALLFADRIGPVAAAAIDSAFLVALALVILREIVAGRNWRNLKTVVLVSLLAAANIGFHTEAILTGAPDVAVRAGTTVIVGLIMLIGGRVTPSFTRNWLVRHEAATLPAPFGRFDIAALAVAGTALALWIAVPDGAVTGIALLAAAVIQSVRLWRWRGTATWREPLVLILHVGYLFVPVGFVLVGLSILGPDLIPSADALHAWTVGAVATMTLAVMTRATLGQTGRDLVAGPSTHAIYAAILVAVVARAAVPFAPAFAMMLLTLAGMGWTAAFCGFALVYGPMMLSRRIGA
jgi:uncharacterized protein involved in response to NO